MTGPHLTPQERTLIDRASANGGECAMNYGEASAAMRLTERGIGYWKQDCPFVATFVLGEESVLLALLIVEGIRRSDGH